ncbi:MAG: hypothetical protein WEB04_06680 [Dehalococcoidia bacterium]
MPMGSSKPAAALGLLVMAAVALSAACGSDDSSGSKSSTAVPTVPAAIGLDSFHYVASLTLRESDPGGAQITVSTEGDYQAPDRHSFTFLTGLGTTSIRTSAVVIGSDVWLRQGDDAWRKTALNDPQVGTLIRSAFSTIRPQFLGGPEFEQVRENVRRLPSNQEFVNDVPTVHYRVEASANDLIAAFIEGGAGLVENVRGLRWELWLARDGEWPVRILAAGTVESDLPLLTELGLATPTQWELRVDITRPNDATLAVEAPPEG